MNFMCLDKVFCCIDKEVNIKNITSRDLKENFKMSLHFCEFFIITDIENSIFKIIKHRRFNNDTYPISALKYVLSISLEELYGK